METGCGSVGFFCYITCSFLPFISFTTIPHLPTPPLSYSSHLLHLCPIAGCIHVDKRLAEIKSQLERGQEVQGGLLTHMLITREMSVEEIYANVTEMLLAGVDTVCVCVCLCLCVSVSVSVCLCVCYAAALKDVQRGIRGV